MRASNRRRDHVAVESRQLDIRQAQSCLPPELTDDVPRCAHNCILQFIQTAYQTTACDVSSNLEHLCTTRTQSGQTLGEASLQCVASYCSNESNNAVLLSAYRVCEGIKDAVPNTASVINATIRPSTPQAPTIQNAVPTITANNPASTPTASGLEPPEGTQTSMVISGDGMSVTMDIHMSPTGGAASPSMTMTVSNFRPEQTTNPARLSTLQIAAIAAGGAVAALIVAGIVLFFCRRRRRAKQDNNSSTNKKPNPEMTNARSLEAPKTSPRRMFGQNNRRSFWRMSIKPEDIGVAVTGKEKARNSTSSENSMLKYMYPDDIRSSWPTPEVANMPGAGAPVRPGRDSLSTIFDEDLEQQQYKPMVATIAAKAGSERSKPNLQPLNLNPRNVGSPALDSARTGELSNPLSLTPKYDNGHFSQILNAGTLVGSLDQTIAASRLPPESQTSRLSLDPAGATSPRRNKLQKKLAATRALMSSRSESRSENRSDSPVVQLRPPDQLGIASQDLSLSPFSGPVSPLAPSPLQPGRSRPLSPGFAPTTILPVRSSSLRRKSNGFLGTDSISSDGLASEYSLDWPVPPSRAVSSVSRDGGLAASRGSVPLPLPIMPRRDLFEPVDSYYSVEGDSAADLQLSPNSRAKVTPTRQNSGGDLFFKVEMR